MLHFSVKISIDSFYLRRDLRFWVSKNLSHKSELESSLSKIGKMLFLLRCLLIPTCLSWKLHIWNLYQGLNWRWYIFKRQMWYIRRKKQFFCPLRWNIDELKTQWCPINILVLSIVGVINFRSYRLDLFCRGLYRDVLLHIWVIFKCDLLLLCSSFSWATLTKNIAVRLCLLFSTFSNQSKAAIRY